MRLSYSLDDSACGAARVPGASEAHRREGQVYFNTTSGNQAPDQFVSSSDSGKVFAPSWQGLWGKGCEVLRVGPSGCPARRWITEEKDRSALTPPDSPFSAALLHCLSLLNCLLQPLLPVLGTC